MNVLVVGNGFDRKIGLKTDFVSSLAWMKETGYGVGGRFHRYSDKLFSPFIDPHPESRIPSYKIIKESSLSLTGEKFSIRNHSAVKYFEEPQETQLANDLLYLLPEITNNNKSCKEENANIWYCFIKLLMHEKENNLLGLNISKFTKYLTPESNWVDLEGLIQESIRLRALDDGFRAGIFSVSRYFDVFSLANLLSLDITKHQQQSQEVIYKLVWDDFLEFKTTLSKYLAFVSTKSNDFWSKFDVANSNFSSTTQNKNIINFSEYKKIINFNYTNFLPDYFEVYYVHGNVDDFSNIVFGLDMNIRGGEFQADERKTKFEISLHRNKQLLKFSKISQLLHLQIDKNSAPLNIISALSIVGHSIGEQDYSYFFSILDRNVDTIQLNCFWYEFNNGGNNKESTKEALFEMLTSYEKYANQRILHKMIFEGRIKFKEVFIPKLFN